MVEVVSPPPIMWPLVFAFVVSLYQLIWPPDLVTATLYSLPRSIFCRTRCHRESQPSVALRCCDVLAARHDRVRFAVNYVNLEAVVARAKFTDENQTSAAESNWR